MTVTLELASEIEARLRQKAEREGQEFTDFLQTVVEREVDEDTADAGGSAADLFAGRLGGIHSSDGRESENAGENSVISDQVEKNKAALEVLRKWREQNATNDPAEIERRQAEWEEFKTVLDEDRPSERKLFS